MLQVVGTMFIENRKLLIDKPFKRPTYQMVGGRIEESETPLEGAVRESIEELQIYNLDSDNFEFVMDFEEIATSDQRTPIQFFLFKYTEELPTNPKTSNEIEKFLWYDTSCNVQLSNTLRDVVIPYCKTNNLID